MTTATARKYMSKPLSLKEDAGLEDVVRAVTKTRKITSWHLDKQGNVLVVNFSSKFKHLRYFTVDVLHIANTGPNRSWLKGNVVVTVRCVCTGCLKIIEVPKVDYDHSKKNWETNTLRHRPCKNNGRLEDAKAMGF